IFTAGHVVNVNKENDESLLLASWELNSPNVTEFNRTAYIDDNNEGIDVGYIEISKENAKILGKKFVNYKVIKNNINHLPKDDVIVSGYPFAIISIEKTDKFNIHTVRASYFRTATVPTIKFPLHLSSEKHIVLNYQKIVEDSYGNKVKIPDAPGISGGSIWAMNANIKGIWSPENTNLIGIQFSWHKKNRYLVGMQIQYLVNLIIDEYEGII
ncbi:hypothetical protein KKF86_08295, partial [bacterium]|nr:hypothetical protein [bacterium]